MGNSPVDRNTEYMKTMWGTTSLMTDYWSLPHKTEDPEEVELNEVMHHKAKRTKTLSEEEIFSPEEYKDIPDRYCLQINTENHYR